MHTELENIEDMYYLGCEYMYKGKYQKCIDTLVKYLELSCNNTFNKYYCMKYIARSYKYLGNYNMARIWLERAIGDIPYVREFYVLYGLLLYDIGDYRNCIIYLTRAINIRYKSLLDDSICWGNDLYHVLSICYYKCNKFMESLYYITIAYKLDPTNNKILNNKKIIEDMINP